jgi:WD40 repeat protein/serine/threonine protein kinase
MEDTIDPEVTAMHIRCPHCQNPVEVIGDQDIAKVTCPSCGSAFDLLPETTSYFLSKKAIAHFELLDELGTGGFGTVWKARDTQLDRFVAIKVPRFEHSDPQHAEFFLREARAAAQLRHPQIVAVHEVGRDDGTLYIVSDFVQGVTLHDRLTAGPLTPREAAELVAQAAEAVHHAHESGVIHRDLKPKNIILDSDGRPLIMDFGLAKREAGEITMTIDGKVLGTVGYMSPEQAAGEGHHVDRRTDVYSLGVILFELLTGELPFRGNQRMLLHQVIHDDPPSPRKFNNRIPRDLETICLKAIAKEPHRRFPAALDLAADLRRYLTGEFILSRPVSRVERAWRWCKRNPALSGLWAAVAVSLLAGTIIASYFALDARANAATAKANAKREADQRIEALAQKDRADRAVDEATANLYLWDMGRIQTAWDNNEIERVRDLLGKYDGQSAKKDLRGFEWYYWDRLANDYAMDFRRHTGPVWSVTFSPDGKLLASAGADHTVLVADALTGDALRTLKGHSGQVRSVVFSTDGTRIATASDDETVKTWSATTGEELRTFKGHTGAVYSVAFETGGNRLASASTDQTIRICDASTGELLQTINGNDDLKLPGNVAYSGSVAMREGLLAACMNSGNATIWSADSGMPLRILSHGGRRLDGIRILGVAFDPKHGDLATAGSDQTIRLWDVSSIGNGRETRKLVGHTRQVTAVAFSPNGNELISGSDDQTVKVWDTVGTRETQPVTFKGHANSITSVAYAATAVGGKLQARLASASVDGSVKVWDSTSGKAAIWRYNGEPISHIALHPQGQKLMVVGLKGLQQLDPATGKRIHTRREGRAICFAYSPDDKHFAFGELNGTLKCVSDEAEIVFKGHTGRITSIAFHPDGKRLASGSLDRTVIIWDCETGAKLHPPMRHASPVLQVAFSPDGKRLASAGDPNLRIWNVETGEELPPLAGHTLRSATVTFNQDGSQVASAGFDQTIKLWDGDSGKQLRTLRGHSGYVNALAFSPDGKRLASASEDRSVKLWAPASGEPVLTLEEFGKGVSNVVFSPNGARLITAEKDGIVAAWDTKRREDSVVFHRSAQSAAEEALHTAATTVLPPRPAALRNYSLTNLKSIGLALHMHEDNFKRLPAQAIRGTDGKALLSWRVAILPFLENDALFKQFRLDEPWDSEHNKSLIEKMPAVYASPALKPEQHEKGLTSYLAPLSRQPPVVLQSSDKGNQSLRSDEVEMVFDRLPSARIAEVIDGLSNTIALVEVNPQAAVIWSKPDDLLIDNSDPMQDLVGQCDNGFYALLLDGSVRFIRNSLNRKTFRNLLEMNDGQTIGEFAF